MHFVVLGIATSTPYSVMITSHGPFLASLDLRYISVILAGLWQIVEGSYYHNYYNIGISACTHYVLYDDSLQSS